MVTKTDISYKTIFFIFATLAALWFVLQIADILLMLFIAFILMSAFRPIIDWLHDRKFPRILAIILLYGVFLLVFGGIVLGTIPTLVSQTIKLLTHLPALVTQLLPNLNFDANYFSQQVQPIGENVLKLTVGIFSNVIAIMTVLVFTFYFLLERKKSEKILAGFIGDSQAEHFVTVIRNIEYRLGAWVLGEFILMLTIGILTYIGLLVLHIEYALPLAIMAGMLEIVPTIGPIVSAVPAIIVALSISPLLAISIAALYFIIQQLENNLIVPIVMKRSVGLSPLVTIVSLMIGAKIAGIIGAILAVPILLVLQEIFTWYTNKDK